MTTAGKVLLAVGSVLAAMATTTTMTGCQGDPKPEEPPVTILPDDLIDDFEDGDDSILQRGGRAGFWYTYHDPNSGTTPVLEPMDGVAVQGKEGVLTVRASGWREYVGFGFQFKKALTAANPEKYDLSGYKGIAFRVRGTGNMSVGIALPEVLPPSEGGTCQETSPPTRCHDVHKAPFSVLPDWRQRKIAFSSLHQEGWGVQTAFKLGDALAFQIDSVEAGPFDVQIDDIGLYK
jgi:hypothetical protein